MNSECKKGFTLVELLAVIVVLGIIATIGGIGVSSIIESSKKSAREQQITNIVKAAKEWAVEHTEKLPDTYPGSIIVTVDQLKAAGKLTETPTDPASGGEMSGYVKITCTTNCVSYTYEYLEFQ